MKNTKAVYKIFNIINDKVYVGSSKNWKNRRQEHFRDLVLKQHHSKNLQFDYDKYGKENFMFEIIEYVSSESDLLKREQYYIDNLHSEYNIFKTAGSALGYKMTKEQLIFNSEKAKGQKNPNAKLTDVDVDNIFILRKTKTVKEISIDYNVSISTISRLLNKKTYFKTPSNSIKHKRIYTPEGKEKLSLLAKKRKNNAKVILDMNTGVFYNSITELSIILGIPLGTLYDRIKGLYKPLKHYVIV